MTDPWKRPTEEKLNLDDPKQMQLDFTTPDLKTAQQQGIRWVPEDATPEQVKEWHETEGKWWGDRALMFVVIASLIQFGAMGFMYLIFWVIDLMTN